MTLKRIMLFSMVLIGGTAIVSQIVFLREFLVIFYGNEISIGIILASWLIWGALGSALLGRYSDKIRAKILTFGLFQFVLSIILPITLLFARALKNIMGIVPGELIGFLPMALVTFIVLFGPCLVMGFMFSLTCCVYRNFTDTGGKSIAEVYIAEAVGALVGGFLVSYFLIRFIHPLDILFLLSFLNILASLLILRHSELASTQKASSFAIGAIFVLLALAITLGGGSYLKKFSEKILWPNFNVLESRNSLYGNITIIERGQQKSFYANGLHLYTIPDYLSSEESSHFGLLEVEKCDKVLLIGGGIGGLLGEILKHPVKKVDYVELDPVIMQMAKKYLNKKDALVLSDPKVNIINKDGRFFVKESKEKYDAIIISLGDPYTAQVNRFYTVGFFHELKRILNKKGVVSFALTSSANYIGEELRDYLRSVYLSVREVFPYVLVMPGDTAYFLATESPEMLTYDSKILSARLAERGISTQYVRDYYLFDKLSDERVKYAKDQIEKDVYVEKNEDFKPISYYYAIAFWSAHFDVPIFRKLIRSITPLNVWAGLVIFCLLISIFCVLGRINRKNKTVLLAVATTGFSEINFQIAVILAFQVIYGYVFYKIGIIITAFMVGLALGGWVISRRINRIQHDLALFRWTQVSICLYPLILPIFFQMFNETKLGFLSWMGANIILPFLPIIAGFIGGVQFPLANKICLGDEYKLGHIAGLSYGLDLLGACIGSGLAAAFLIPILGIFGTCFLAASINVVVLILLFIARA